MNLAVVLVQNHDLWAARDILEEVVDVYSRKLSKDHSQTLLAEQNLPFATAIADRAAVIETGRTVWTGATAEFRADAHLVL